MKNQSTLLKVSLLAAVCAMGCITLTGCETAINTKDVTKITVTETGIRIGQNVATQTYELLAGRSQVELIKIPTGLNAGSNCVAADAEIVPQVVTSYELNAHSAIFGNAAMTTTMSTGGTNAVNTTVGGNHDPINIGTGTQQANNTVSSTAVSTGTSLVGTNTTVTVSTNGVTIGH